MDTPRSGASLRGSSRRPSLLRVGALSLMFTVRPNFEGPKMRGVGRRLFLRGVDMATPSHVAVLVYGVAEAERKCGRAGDQVVPRLLRSGGAGKFSFANVVVGAYVWPSAIFVGPAIFRR